jgi:hypothetical protein
MRFAVLALTLSIAACSAPEPTPAPASSTSQAPPAPAAAPPVAPVAAPTPPAATSESPLPPGGGPSSSPDRAQVAPQRTQAEPSFHEVTLPAGTSLTVTLTTAVASDTSHAEDQVRGTLTRALVVDGVTAVPANAEIIGSVREARRSGRVKGRASIAFRFEQLRVGDESLAIRTAVISREAAANRRDDVKKGAIGGAAGAVVGGILGGGDGAAIGAGVGATGAVMATRGDEVRLAVGATVRTTLQQPLKVIVPR